MLKYMLNASRFGQQNWGFAFKPGILCKFRWPMAGSTAALPKQTSLAPAADVCLALFVFAEFLSQNRCPPAGQARGHAFWETLLSESGDELVRSRTFGSVSGVLGHLVLGARASISATMKSKPRGASAKPAATAGSSSAFDACG
jgi:hypothetical protein